ncbi:BamA/TamA family outer membrane protein [candidate division KSB1 bacterium]|nr:BamA/TamA family outer membrane protein [candidate division KSB1 bacterium]
MNRIIIYILLILCARFSNVVAEQSTKHDSSAYRIRSVRLHGVEPRNDGQTQVKKITGIALSDTLVPALVEDLLQLYQANGYAFVAVDSAVVVTNTDSLSAHIDVYLNLGTSIRIGDMDVANSPDVLRERVLSSKNTLFSKDNIEYFVDEILNTLENQGFPFAVVNIDSIRFDSHTAHISLDIQNGPLIRIQTIKIHGNRVTNDNVVIRESRIRLGEIYQQEKIDRIPQRLAKLGFIRKVEPPQISVNDKAEGELLISLEEGNMNKLDGVVGYQPGTEFKPGYFTGLIDITVGNIFGSGRRLEAYWERKDRSTQQMRLRYVEPWLLGYPIHVGGRLEQLIQDTSFVKRNFMLEAQLPISDAVDIYAHAGREYILPDSIASVIWNLPRSRSWLVNAGFRYDVRNHPYNPSRGVYYETSFEIARKENESHYDDGTTTFVRKRLAMDAEVLVPTWRWQTASLALHWRRLNTNEPQIWTSDMFRMGGSQTLRGYREDEFIGTEIAWSNLEYRYLVSDYSRLFVFMDGGYYSRPLSNLGAQQDYKMSYGFGMRVDTRVGIVGVDFGLGEGRGLSTGLLHVRLVSQF